MRILIVDDEKIKRITLADDLSAVGHEVVTAADGEEAWTQLQTAQFDVVVSDLKMPRLDGIDLLKRIKQGRMSDMAVVMMTAYGSIPVAVEAMRLGAFDFVTKPFRNEDLFPLLARLDRTNRPQADAASPAGEASVPKLEHMVVGKSKSMVRVRQMIEVCSRTEANVLLLGETGCGKDLISRAIHGLSHRRSFPYVKVGCTLFPENLIESELYGHEKGSFTGAEQRRKGRFELAENGTLYLDDVDDIPLEQQSKLLRAIEEKVYERVGGTTPIKANVRIIASTKRNLLEKTGEGTFRQDLYYRLDVLRIVVPPLRERIEDLPMLAECLLKEIADDGTCEIEPGALDRLIRHDWPGNVRELTHALERAYLIGCGRITADLLETEMAGIASPAAQIATSGKPTLAGDFQAAMDQTERDLLVRALRTAGGNKTAAAAALGMKASTFRDKLAKHGLG
jgi:two-component system, NtrC family, response regulator PilR